MKKKKLEKKYKELQEQYKILQEQNDTLFCEYIRLKTDDERIKVMTNEQIINTRKVLLNLGQSIADALHKVYH